MVFCVHDTVIEDKVWVAFIRRDFKNDLEEIYDVVYYITVWTCWVVLFFISYSDMYVIPLYLINNIINFWMIMLLIAPKACTISA